MKREFSSSVFSPPFIIGQEKKEKRGNRTLPFADIATDFIACSEMDGAVLSLYTQPCRLKAGIFVLCLQGKIHASINLNRYEICPGDFVCIFPGSIIQYHGQTEELKIGILAFSAAFMGNINLTNSSMDFLPVMMENPLISLPEQTVRWFHDYFALLERSVLLHPERLHPEIVRCILHSVLYGVGYLYNRHSWDGPVSSRGEEIYRELLRLVRMNYQKERGVAYYARKLNISAQHLGSTVRQLTGRTILDIIADMVIMDAKAQLKSTSLSIQEIAWALNFPSVSFFGKYFKRYVAMSPQKYRDEG